MTRAKPNVLILVRPITKATEVLRLRSMLMEGSSTISLVLINGACALAHAFSPKIAGLPGCCTIDPRLAERFGIPLLTAGELADQIEQADLVVPC